MKQTMRVGAAMLAAASLTGNAWAGCVSDADMAALRTAAMQQELMVAAFSCHDIDLYNHFVRSHQPELIQSDARLKAYFVQRDGGRRGEASYHSYKTELANASSLRSIRSTEEFCDRAGADFDASEGLASLAPAVERHRWAIEAMYQGCRADEAAFPASLETPPSRTELVARMDRPDTPTPSHPYTSPRPETPETAPRAARSEIKTPLPHRRLGGESL
jgi:hypothetical protein